MIRGIIITLLLFLLPFAFAWAVYRLSGKDRPDAWYYMPLIGGGILAVGWFVWLGLQSTPETGKTYQPAYEKDGRIIQPGDE